MFYSNRSKVDPFTILSGFALIPNVDAQDYKRLENMYKACHGKTGENGYTAIPDLKWKHNV